MRELHQSDEIHARKARGAFFTSPIIADYLAEHAVDDDPAARVLDPTCGESIFLQTAGGHLLSAGAEKSALGTQLFGVDIENESLGRSRAMLSEHDISADLRQADFFEIPAPNQLGSSLPQMDAVIGNPPFVRFQHHFGAQRHKSVAAALAQGVRLSGLASSWAALLVHACAFLKPEGRLAMVLPAELLTVGYAEPIRQWLRHRFAAVHLIMFERLQFADANEKVVLLIARGTGGCDAFSFMPVEDANDLADLKLFGRSHFTVAPNQAGKWTDLLIPIEQRQIFQRVVGDHCVPLSDYGKTELGTVTGANSFFAMSEPTRVEYGLEADQLARICPPGTKHLKGPAFTPGAWKRLKDAGQPVWLLHPAPDDKSPALRRYLKKGIEAGVPDAYKCRVRTPWWRPPLVTPPDLFFTYMSHRQPRLIRNSARVSFLNSMHGLRLGPEAPAETKAALPILCFNTVTMLGAEVFGRSYGGGILKMEPSEAASLPVPSPEALVKAHERLAPERSALAHQLEVGHWTSVAKRVDDVLLHQVLGIPRKEKLALHDALVALRSRRIGSDRDTNEIEE